MAGEDCPHPMADLNSHGAEQSTESARPQAV